MLVPQPCLSGGLLVEGSHAMNLSLVDVQGGLSEQGGQNS